MSCYDKVKMLSEVTIDDVTSCVISVIETLYMTYEHDLNFMTARRTDSLCINKQYRTWGIWVLLNICGDMFGVKMFTVCCNHIT